MDKEARAQQLQDLFVSSGLSNVLELEDISYSGGLQEFTKLRVKKNRWRIRSVEIWELKSSDYFRIHYADDAPGWLKAAAAGLPAAHVRSVDDWGVRLEGNYLAIAANLAGALLSAQHLAP